MMRKWRTDLFRYGLRQTYDIAIPLPGVRFWALHQQVAELDKELRTPFVFSLKAEDLNDGNWPAKATEFGVPVPLPPQPQRRDSRSKIIGYFTADESVADRFEKIDFEIPAGYRLESAEAKAILSQVGQASFTWHGGNSQYDAPNSLVTGDLAHFKHLSGMLAAMFSYNHVHTAGLTLSLTFGRTPATEQAWKREAWAAIKASAEARYNEKLARVQEERDRLWRLLNGKDTLSLRRLEREELVRLVMQWLMGPDFPVVMAPGNGAWTPPPRRQ